jgi:hypothetical protein
MAARGKDVMTGQEIDPIPVDPAQTAPAATEAPRPVTTEKIELDAKRYTDLIEVDLWSRFSKRLWAVTATILTVAALAGIFGLPIIVENKVNVLFAQRAKQFDETVNQYFTLYRAYFLIATLSSAYRTRFDEDISTVSAFLEKRNPDGLSDGKESSSTDVNNTSGKGAQYKQIVGVLASLMSDKDAIRALDSLFLLRQLTFFSVAEDVNLPTSQMIRTEIKTFSGGSASEFRHPFRNGKFSSFVIDLRLRLMILAALEKVSDQLRDEILQLGASSEVGKSMKKLEVEAYLQTKILPNMAGILNEVISHQNFSVSKEQEQFMKEDRFSELMRLYLQEVSPGFAEVTVKGAPKVDVIDQPKKKEM